MSGVEMLSANGRWQPKAYSSRLHADSRSAAKNSAKWASADPQGTQMSVWLFQWKIPPKPLRAAQGLKGWMEADPTG